MGKIKEVLLCVTVTVPITINKENIICHSQKTTLPVPDGRLKPERNPEEAAEIISGIFR